MAECISTGVRTYFEEHADGEPVVLLHGKFVGGDSWRTVVPALAKNFWVLVPDRRGHGRTPDVAGPYTYEAMAKETISFIEQTVGGPADLVGFSDGGNVALHVARDRADLVRKVVSIGANFHRDGLHPAVQAELRYSDPASPVWHSVRQLYEATSPDGPEHWPVFMRKVVEMGLTGPTMAAADLSHVDCPVLVVVGDDDIVSHMHTVMLFESLPQAQLAVIPGVSHIVPEENSALVSSLVLDFLGDDSLTRPTPLRFRPVPAP